MLKHSAKYHPHIKYCLQKYPHLKERFKKKKNYIIQSPIQLGEPLKNNLNGLRSFPFAGNFIIIYIVCKECKNLQHQEKNKCLQCHETPENSVIFLTFGPHDPTYNSASAIRGLLGKNKFKIFT